MRLVQIHACGIALLAMIGGSAANAADATGPWLSGQDLAEKLAEPITVQWQAAPLKHAIATLARAHRLALFLDRRIDPDRPLTLAIKARPLAGVCSELAASAGIGYCRLGPLGYFGPRQLCADLPTVAALREDEVGRLPSTERAAWTRASAWSWPDFSTPRELVAQLAQSAQVRIDGIEQLPHDLWASADLPPLSVTQRLTLLAAQFDLTFRLEENGRAASLVAWPDKPAIERSYTSGTHSRELAAEWQALAPRSTLRVEGAKIIVRGPLEDHERIADSRKPAARPTRDGKPAGVQVHTLDLRGAPLDRVLESLRKQLDLQIEIDDSVAQAKIDMRQNVSFKVEQASLDQLLAAALKPAGLSFTRQGTKVHVFPAAK